MEMIHGVALQAPNFNGPLVVAMQDASALAKHFDGTNSRATQAQYVGVQNRHGRTSQVAAGDFLDEGRHVDVGGAGVGARRVEAVETTVGLYQRFAAA